MPLSTSGQCSRQQARDGRYESRLGGIQWRTGIGSPRSDCNCIRDRENHTDHHHRLHHQHRLLSVKKTIHGRMVRTLGWYANRRCLQSSAMVILGGRTRVLIILILLRLPRNGELSALRRRAAQDGCKDHRTTPLRMLTLDRMIERIGFPRGPFMTHLRHGMVKTHKLIWSRISSCSRRG